VTLAHDASTRGGSSEAVVGHVDAGHDAASKRDIDGDGG
jgi:hypothetical protein